MPCSRPWFYSYKIYDKQCLMKLPLKTPRRSTMASLAASLLVVTAFGASATSVRLASAATKFDNGPIYYLLPGNPPARKAVTETGTAVAQVPVALRTFESSVRISPDGTKIVWADFMTSSVKVSSVDGTGVITIASSANASWTRPQFSPDGSKIYVTGQGPQFKKIFSFDADVANQDPSTKVVLDPANNNQVTAFDVSSTGKIAYITGSFGSDCPNQSGQGVYLRDVSGSGTGTLLPNSCADLTGGKFSVPQNVAWSTNGAKLYVSQEIVERPQSGTVIHDTIIEEFTESGIVAGGPFFDTGTTERQIFSLRMSPDGEKIAYVMIPASGTTAGATDGLYVLDIASKTASLLVVLDRESPVTWGAVPAVEVATTTEAPTTTAAPVTTTVAPTTTVPVATSTAVVPGVTVTDTKVYTKSVPKKVAAGSAIAVMTPAQARVNDIVSLTPRICLAAEDDLVFIKTGRCVAQVVNEKTGRVLRALTTRVVADEVSELNVGNEIVTLAPIYFGGGSAAVDARAKKRLQSIKERVSAAGTVLIVGHSGILMGNTPENQELGRARAIAARNELRSIGAKGPFYFTSAGALAPATTKMTVEAQAKNRRVVIVLIP
jgi:outer membrane protein OmpA-like peptidoglycan-associated protein